MSNDDGFAPPPPEDTSESGLGGLAGEPGSDAAEPGAAEATGPDPLDPTQAMPSESSGAPATPPLDSTQVMPTEPITPRSNPVQSGEGIPPIVPGAAAGAAMAPRPNGVPLEEEFPDDPWYKNPRVIAGIVLGLVILGLIILLFVLLGGDDDEGGIDDLSTDPVSLVVLRTNASGAPLSTTLNVKVIAQEGAADNYIWITPGDTIAGQDAALATDATGRAEFRWGPTDEAADTGWTTTISIGEGLVPDGDQAVTGIGAQCQLERAGDTSDLVVATDVLVGEDGGEGLGRYDFPNVTFAAGDRVTCSMANQVATPPPTTIAETTTTAEVTTTVAETTTTTVAPTTAAPTTAAPTTAAPTTAAPTTAAPTTAAPTTAAPSGPTVADFLTDNGYTQFRDLLIQVGVLTEIENSPDDFTLFVATDQAVATFLGIFDPTTMNLTDVMRSHWSSGEAVDSSDTRTDIDVESGGPQPLDFASNPPTVGDAEIVDADNAVEDASVGIVHVIDAMLVPQP